MLAINVEGSGDPGSERLEHGRRAGGEHYYRDDEKMMVVEVRTQPSFTAGRGCFGKATIPTA